MCGCPEGSGAPPGAETLKQLNYFPEIFKNQGVPAAGHVLFNGHIIFPHLVFDVFEIFVTGPSYPHLRKNDRNIAKT